MAGRASIYTCNSICWEIAGHKLAARRRPLIAQARQSSFCTESPHPSTFGAIPVVRMRDERHWISLSLPGHFPLRFPPDFKAVDVTTSVCRSASRRFAEAGRAAMPVALVGWSTGGFWHRNLAARYPAERLQRD